MKKIELLRALQTEIRRHTFDTFLTEERSRLPLFTDIVHFQMRVLLSIAMVSVGILTSPAISAAQVRGSVEALRQSSYRKSRKITYRECLLQC
jgi:hypothetical protein